METLKIDCMAETVNGKPYEEPSLTSDDTLTKKEVDNTIRSNIGSSVVLSPQGCPPWLVEQIDASVSNAISSNVMSDYIEFVNNFDNMVKNILGKDEAVSHSQEYIENLPNKIVNQFCKELCQILLEEYEKPSESWESLSYNSNRIVTAIGSTSGHAIKGIKVYDPWHTIARMFDIGVITAKDLGISEEEFNEHISWYKVKKKK